MEGGTDVETELTSLLRAGTYDRAATLAIATYGPEVCGFLLHLLGEDQAGHEVFAQASEDLWRGLPSFRADCSVRTWMYTVARHAAARYRRTPWNRGGRCGDSTLDDVVADARSRTAPWLRTDTKDRWRELRASLEPDDRTLLVLRIDRDLPWTEVARVMLDDDAPAPGALDRESARLRKRLQLLKTELRARARAAGLLDDDA